MKLRELREVLDKMPAEADEVDVLFDTEAAKFNYHMVDVDSAYFENEPRPHVALHSDAERRHSDEIDDLDLSDDVKRALKSVRDEIEQAYLHKIDSLKKDLEESNARADKFAQILERTANALKGEPASSSMHSWHDLPEVALKLKRTKR